VTAVAERTRVAAPMTVAPAWVERHCVVPDGFLQGRPFTLYRDQLRFFLAFYAVKPTAEWVPERPITGPAFLYRRALDVGPQKVGKDPRGAAHVCLEGAGPALFAGWAGKDHGYACADWGCGCGWEYPYEQGEPMGMRWPTPLIQLTAVSEDQTDNVYDALRPMIELGPLADVITKTGEEFIRLPGGGRIETVTSSAPSRLGQRITFAKQGEAGLYTKRNGMAKVADTQYRNLAGTGGRAVLDTNAWDPSEQSVAQREFESGDPGVYRQFTQPPANLSFRNKDERRRILRIVYPKDTWRENGGHVDLDSIEAEAASLAEHDLAQAARFFGNILMAGSGAAVDPDKWASQGPPTVAVREVPAGSRVALGFDGSLSQDSTVLRACTPDGYRFSLPGWSWVRPTGPEMAAWANAHPGEDWRVPRDLVDAAVAEAFALFIVGRMLPDAAFWRDEITRWQRLYGDDVVIPFDTNSARKMAPAFDRWRTAVGNGQAPHDGDPTVTAHVLAMHMAHPRGAQVGDDGRIPLVPVKGDDKRKIDGGLADILAYEAAMTMPELVDVGVPEFFAL
jgi:hypothetical protein